MTDAEFQAFLEDISEAFVRPDFALWQSRVRLPLSLVTATGPITITTQEDLEANFEQYLTACRILHLTALIRDPIDLEECNDGTVLATYRTHLISGGNRIREPYTSTALLHPDAGTWRMSAILNALGHHHWTKQGPLTSGEYND